MKFSSAMIVLVVGLLPTFVLSAPQVSPTTCVGNGKFQNCSTFCASCCAQFPTAFECQPEKTCVSDCRYPVPRETTVYDASETTDPHVVPLDGGILIKTLKLSIDPFMRGRMRDPSVVSYTPAYTLGQPISGFGVGVVVRSENPSVKAGVYLSGGLEFKNYSIRRDLTALQVVKNPNNLPLSTFIGVLGMPGKTAYMAWKEFANAKEGETVFVSTGAGPVGSLIIQIAKLDGLRVIASAGSDEKVQFMKEIGADVVFNYKTTNTTDVLTKEGPIDIYWDNVGGETLDAALGAANFHARFIECGMISGYNNGRTNPPFKNLERIVNRSLSLNGFILGNLTAKHDESFIKKIPPLVASGSIKYKEEVSNGLASVGEAILSVQKGTNKGKAVIHVADA